MRGRAVGISAIHWQAMQRLTGLQVNAFASIEGTPVSLDRATGTQLAPAGFALPGMRAMEAWTPKDVWTLQSIETTAKRPAETEHPALQLPWAWTGSVPNHQAYTMRFKTWQRACFFSPALLPEQPPWTLRLADQQAGEQKQLCGQSLHLKVTFSSAISKAALRTGRS